MAGSAVPVVVSGWSWTAALMGLANLLIGGLLVQIVRTRPTLKKIANEREANLLTERAAEMDKMGERIAALEAQLEQQRARHEAERALDRHRLNNMDQCLTYLFMVFEKMPEKVPEAMAAVKEMRADQLKNEALEKATIHAAAIAHGKGAEG
jgi:uncharacterized protein YigA (DUF484 family)